jgi:hypothetical protein
MKKRPIVIDFSEIKEIALLGVRRTAVFMGLGINAALDDNFTNYDLTKITQLQFVPPEVDNKTISHIKEEFGFWIITCGFRELIETFAIFLDRIHLASLHMGVSCKKILAEHARRIGPIFPKKGIKDKLPLLSSRFGIKTNNPHYIISINQARNCFVHRRGVVGIEDCQNSQCLEVKWMGFDIFIKTPSKEIIVTPPIPQEGILIEEEGTIVGLKLPERTSSFKIGEKLIFSPRDLAEICQFVIFSTNEICSSFMEYAKSLGIKIDDKKPQ